MVVLQLVPLYKLLKHKLEDKHTRILVWYNNNQGILCKTYQQTCRQHKQQQLEHKTIQVLELDKTKAVKAMPKHSSQTLLDSQQLPLVIHLLVHKLLCKLQQQYTSIHGIPTNNGPNSAKCTLPVRTLLSSIWVCTTSAVSVWIHTLADGSNPSNQYTARTVGKTGCRRIYGRVQKDETL